MAVTIYCVSRDYTGREGEYDTLEEAVADARHYWNEEPGPQTFVVLGEAGDYLATLARVVADEEICLTAYADGAIELHRCHYVLDGKGRYLRTEVTALGREVQDVRKS